MASRSIDVAAPATVAAVEVALPARRAPDELVVEESEVFPGFPVAVLVYGPRDTIDARVRQIAQELTSKLGVTAMPSDDVDKMVTNGGHPASTIYASAPVAVIEPLVAELSGGKAQPNPRGYPVYPFARDTVGVRVAWNEVDASTDIYAEGRDDAAVDKTTRRIYDALVKNTDAELVLLEEDSFDVLARREALSSE